MINEIIDFVVLDSSDEPILDEKGLPTLRQGPIVKNIAELIAKGKVSNIESFASIAAEGEQWEWARDYVYFLQELNKVQEYNNNLPEPYETEGGELVTPQAAQEPEAPVRPELKTVEEILEPFARTIFKLKRQSEIDNSVVTISTGKRFDADEVSINRMANAIIKHWAHEPTDTLPWSTADVGTGVMVDITRAELVEAHTLASEAFAQAWSIE